MSKSKDDFFIAKLDSPTNETICDVLSKHVLAYFSNPQLLDPDWAEKATKPKYENPDHNIKPKPKPRKKKVKVPHLTPQQQTIRDYKGRWCIENEREVYYWRATPFEPEICLVFRFLDRTFLILPNKEA